MLRIELLIEPRLKKVLLRALGLTISRFHSFHHVLQGFYCFLAILHGVILAEHAVFIGFCTFSRTTNINYRGFIIIALREISAEFDWDAQGFKEGRRYDTVIGQGLSLFRRLFTPFDLERDLHRSAAKRQK